MAIKISVDTGDLAFKDLTRAVSAARDTALRATVLAWHREILPEHFKAHNQSRYGMKKRTEAYKKRKRREGKSSDPNVYTGRLKEKIQATKPSIGVNRDGASLIYRGLPRHTFITSTQEKKSLFKGWDDAYLKKLHPKHRENVIAWRLKHPKPGQGAIVRVERPDKVKELTAVDSADQKRMNSKFQHFFDAALKNLLRK